MDTYTHQIDSFSSKHVAEQPVQLLVSRYRTTDRIAISVTSVTGEMLLRATVNAAEIPLSEGEVLIKDWSENEGVAAALIKAGVIGPELRREKLDTGFVYAAVHKLLIDVPELS